MRIDTSSPNYKWIVLAAAAIGVYSTVIDMGIVNIALPTITAHFDASLTAVQWIVLIYLVIISAILLPIGSASDRFGRKRLYVIGFLLLSGGAALAAAAPSLPWLFGARAIQAVGAASVQGLSMAIAVAVFPPQERGRALGLMATVVALGAVTGPPIGGVLVDAFGWRAVFLVNTALAPLGALFALVALKDAAIGTPSAQGGKTDWAGAVTSSTALVSVLLVFSRGSEVGWTSPFVLAFAAIAIVSLALFIAAELRAEHPMIDLALFRRSAFTLGGIAGWLVFASASAYVMVTPFYLQGVLEYRPREAALIMTPTAFVLAVTGPIAGRLSDKLGPRIPATAGAIIVAAGFVGFSFAGTETPFYVISLAAASLGLGMGLFQPSNNSSVLSAVEASRYGVASAFLTLVRNLGQVTGVVLAAALLAVGIRALGVEPDLGPLRDPDVAANPALIAGFVDGLRMTLRVATALLIAGATLSLFKPAPRPEEAEGEAVSTSVETERRG